MARIMQDGFETESIEIPSNWQRGNVVERLGISKFISKDNESSSNDYYKIGLCSPRGGYGQKGFSLQGKHDYGGYHSCCVLKYDLTEFCNDTSELYYRVWIKPYDSYVIPIAVTDLIVENNLKLSYYNTEFFKKCNFALSLSNIDGETYILNCYCNGDLVYSYNYLFYEQWVKLDIRLKVGDANNGIFQLRINDKLITTYNGATGTVNPKYMYIGNMHWYGKYVFRCDYDDIAINDTTGNVNNSWCGNGSIVGILPTANGSKTMFTPGIEGTQNYENVDDLTPDGDVTYNSSYALNDIDLFKFTIPEELGIPSTEYINAISVMTSAKFVEQPTDIGHIVSDGVNETLIKQYSLSNDYTQHSSIIQEKSDGTKYKVNDIESLEFGYKTLESSEAQEE